MGSAVSRSEASWWLHVLRAGGAGGTEARSRVHVPPCRSGKLNGIVFQRMTDLDIHALYAEPVRAARRCNPGLTGCCREKTG